jgi:AcrR family transcriptional regulator
MRRTAITPPDDAAEGTRARILDAARAEFGTVGLSGARVNRIAEQAGANKRMLYYYFGNKEELFAAVLESAYEHIREAERALDLDALPPREAIARLVAFSWQYNLEHPEFMNLLGSANRHQGLLGQSSTRVRRMHSPLTTMIESILQRGAASGEWRSDVDAVQLYISIAGLSYFYLSNNYTLSTIFGRNLKAPKARAERLAHMTAMVLGFLAKESA